MIDQHLKDFPPVAGLSQVLHQPGLLPAGAVMSPLILARFGFVRITDGASDDDRPAGLVR
jgi:hypothetical protein